MPKCPSCGTEGAYIGLQKIECIKSDCKFYKEPEFLDAHKLFTDDKELKESVLSGEYSTKKKDDKDSASKGWTQMKSNHLFNRSHNIAYEAIAKERLSWVEILRYYLNKKDSDLPTEDWIADAEK